MSRAFRARALVTFLMLAAAGCQDYNFNPVGHCLIQPGAESFKLSDISTADVLFVIDDSNSMADRQVSLGQSFSTFIDELNKYNLDRANRGLQPIDFHIAVTTSAVYDNNQLGSSYYCRNTCNGLTGNYCCTTANAPLTIPRECCQIDDPQCTVPGNSCGSGYSCSTSCAGYSGVNVCCSSDLKTVETKAVPCPPGMQVDNSLSPSQWSTCGNWRITYPGSCVASSGGVAFGVGSANAVFPHGSFVSMSYSGTPNPKILHFDKQLYPPSTPCPAAPATCGTGQVCGAGSTCRQSCTGTCSAGFKCVSGACEPTNNAGYTQQELQSFFAKSDGSGNWSGNAIVGVCGAGQEQGIRAGKLAIAKALAGAQGLASGEWPHDNSKLVVVFVGDEDDCSAPEDPGAGVTNVGTPGNDSCVHDQDQAGGSFWPSGAAGPNKEFDVKTYLADYLKSNGKHNWPPELLGAGFIVGTDQCSCQDLTDSGTTQACTAGTPGTCPSCGSLSCYARGYRLLTLANDIANGGSDVVAGPVCSSDFGSILGRLADIVKVPSVLTLPTLPASRKVAVLEILDKNGNFRKTCTGPAPAGTSFAVAEASYDWWFVATGHPNTNITPLDDGSAVAESQYVYVNHARAQCEANPGETYSLEYLGLVPPPSESNPTGGCRSVDKCVAYLGGDRSSWQCCDSSGTCSDAANPVTLSTLGSCLCVQSQR